MFDKKSVEKRSNMIRLKTSFHNILKYLAFFLELNKMLNLQNFKEMKQNRSICQYW